MFWKNFKDKNAWTNFEMKKEASIKIFFSKQEDDYKVCNFICQFCHPDFLALSVDDHFSDLLKEAALKANQNNIYFY